MWDFLDALDNLHWSIPFIVGLILGGGLVRFSRWRGDSRHRHGDGGESTSITLNAGGDIVFVDEGGKERGASVDVEQLAGRILRQEDEIGED